MLPEVQEGAETADLLWPGPTPFASTLGMLTLPLLSLWVESCLKTPLCSLSLLLLY